MTIEDTTIGSLKCYVEKVNGKTFQVLLQGVKFRPELSVNLFIIKKALLNVYKIRNEEIIIHLSKGLTTLFFDKFLKS
jgi:hypothetical protein